MNTQTVRSKKVFGLNKTLFKYISVSYLSIPVSLVTGFFAFRNIDPYYMGIWSAFTILETYAVFLRIGIVNGMNRELPFKMGKGDVSGAMKYAETTLAFTILDVLLLFLLIPVAIYVVGFKEVYLVPLVITVLRIIMSFYITYLSATFRSDDNFDKLSNIQIFLLVIKLLLCPLVLLGFYGFLAYELLLVLGNVILLHYYRPYRIKPKLHKPELIQLFKLGFPIFLSSYAINFIDTLPKLYIIKESTAETLGLYSPVLMLLSTVAILPNTLSTYLYPKFSFNLGKEDDPMDIFRKLLKVYFYSFIVIVLACIAGYFILDYFILLFPKYNNSLPYLKLALLACPFVFFKLGNMFNVVMKKYNYMLFFVLAYALIQGVTLLLLPKYINDILDVVVVSQIITSVLVLLVSVLMNYILVQSLIRSKQT